MPSSALSHEYLAKSFSGEDKNFNQAYNYYVYQIAYCLLGLPMMIVPISLDEKQMPVTVQLVGAPWKEATLFHVGKIIEKEFSFKQNYTPLFSRLYEASYSI